MKVEMDHTLSPSALSNVLDCEASKPVLFILDQSFYIASLGSLWQLPHAFVNRKRNRPVRTDIGTPASMKVAGPRTLTRKESRKNADLYWRPTLRYPSPNP
jgi:hypothetical protein